MGKFFNSRFFEGISKATDLVLIGFYFLVCSIPVFTLGASATAVYYAVHKSVFKGRGYTTEFFHSFKENFKQATLSWLIFIAVIAILCGDIFITKNITGDANLATMAPAFFTVLLIFAILWAIYHFAYIARFENSFSSSLKVSAVFMIANLGWTAIILGILVVGVLAIYRFPILFIFAPGLITAAIHPILERVFKKYMSPEDLEKESQIYDDII